MTDKNAMNIHQKYFINKFYLPKINLEFSKYLIKLANTSIDISDGLLIDLNKMINAIISSLYIDFLHKLIMSFFICILVLF